MELPAITGEKLIRSAGYKWLDNIYRTSIPKNAQLDGSNTDFLVTEYLNEPTRFGNSRFKGWLIGVEVQLFYKKEPDSSFNMMDSEISLARLFEKDGWSVNQSKNHIKDPDTGQISKVFYFTKNINLKEAN
ncbi:tail protein [Furfurilactobacillus siliginis]|nr:tail protein [Furfurilactobacillus siliginis]